MPAVKTSAVVSFTQQGNVLWEKADGAEDDIVPMRLFPVDVPVVYATSGTLIRDGEDTEEYTDILNFSGGLSATVPHPNASVISIVQVGSVSDKRGNPTTATFNFDRITNAIISSKRIYGIVQVNYTATHKKYNFQLNGGPCPTPYEASMLIAISGTDNATATVTAPECEDGGGDINFGSAGIPRISVEVDPESKPAFSVLGGNDAQDDTLFVLGTKGETVGAAFGADAVLKVNPVMSLTHITDWGSLKKDSASYTEKFREVIRFSGGSSVNLRYTPDSGGSYELSGSVYNTKGSRISAGLATEGDIVRQVEETESGGYEYSGSRRVEADEIVLVQSGKEIDGYATVVANYTYGYMRYRLVFGGDSDGLKPANTLFYTLGGGLGRAGALSVSPPEIKDA